MNKNIDNDKIKILIDSLNLEINSYTPWVARKEMSAWAAIVFYLALVWSIIGYILNNYNESINFLDFLFIFATSPIIFLAISLIFALFIHSQFSSIYDKIKLTDAMRKNIYKLLQSEGFNSFDFNINEKSELPGFIHEDYINNHKDNVEESRFPKSLKDTRPLQLLITLWSFKWTKNSESKLSTHEKQESLLYSLIIVSWITLTIVLFKLLLIFFVS